MKKSSCEEEEDTGGNGDLFDGDFKASSLRPYTRQKEEAQPNTVQQIQPDLNISQQLIHQESRSWHVLKSMHNAIFAGLRQQVCSTLPPHHWKAGCLALLLLTGQTNAGCSARRGHAGVTQVFLMAVYVLICTLHSQSCRMIRPRLDGHQAMGCRRLLLRTSSMLWPSFAVDGVGSLCRRRCRRCCLLSSAVGDSSVVGFVEAPSP